MSRTIHPKASEASISFGLVLFAFFALLLIGDASLAPAWYDRPRFGFGSSYWYQSSSLEVFVAVAIFAVPLAIWHLLDALPLDAQVGSKMVRLLGSYRLVLVIFIAGVAGIGLSTSGFAGWLSCYQPEPVITTQIGQFGFFCTPDPTYLAIFLIIPALVSLVCLTFAKAGYLAVSKFR